MRDKWQEYKHYRFKRNGKDCYTWFMITDYWGHIKFTSAKHKISLNVYRILKAKEYLQSNHLYI